MHPAFHEGRRKDRAETLQARYTGRQDVIYTDAAEYKSKAAHETVAVRKDGTPVACCTVSGVETVEAEEVAIALAVSQRGGQGGHQRLQKRCEKLRIGEGDGDCHPYIKQGRRTQRIGSARLGASSPGAKRKRGGSFGRPRSHLPVDPRSHLCHRNYKQQRGYACIPGNHTTLQTKSTNLSGSGQNAQ